MNPLEIVCSDNGPLRLSGSPIVLKDASGKTYDLAGREAIALCRCGQSANKPFCDGSHARTAFSSKVEAKALPPPKPKL
jgi:CDGSH-type Zn-finger protein